MCDTNGLFPLQSLGNQNMKNGPLLAKIANNANVLDVNPQGQNLSCLKMNKRCQGESQKRTAKPVRNHMKQ